LSYKEKFLELLKREGYAADLPMRIAMREYGDLAAGTVIVYGCGEAIPEKMVIAIRSEIFPLIADELPGYSAKISTHVIGLNEPAQMHSHWVDHHVTGVKA